MDFRFRHTFMEKSALKMIGCLSTKKKVGYKTSFQPTRKKKDETIVAFNQLIDISIEKKSVLKIDLN